MIEGKPDMAEIVAREGGALINRGRGLWSLCALHGERTASFKISTDRKHGHCFGCGWHGDSIDYIRAMHNLSFKDALAYLGIQHRPRQRAKQEREKRLKLVQAFRAWERARTNELACILRTFRQMEVNARTEAELQEFAKLKNQIDVLEYHYSILCSRDDREKFELYRETLERG